MLPLAGPHRAGSVADPGVAHGSVRLLDMEERAHADATQKFYRSCRETIAKHGWLIQYVFATEANPCVPFGYTVGLAAAGLPELVISGLPSELTGTLLNDAARLSLNTEIEAGEVLDSIASVPFRVVAAPRAAINLSRRFYGSGTRALQLVWPDSWGNYQSDAGWNHSDAGWNHACEQEVFT